MYKDIITYELAEGVDLDRLLQVAGEVFEGWMKNQKGFLGWEIHQNSQGSMTDIVYWASEQAAKDSEKDMMNCPNAGDWFACYKEGSISSTHLFQKGSYK